MEVASTVLRAAVHDAGTGAGGGVDGGGTFANPEDHMLPSETWWRAGWMQCTTGIALFLLHAHAVSTGNASGSRGSGRTNRGTTLRQVQGLGLSGVLRRDDKARKIE